MTRTLIGLLVAMLLIVLPRNAFALRTGGEGNRKIDVAGFPKGAGAIVNRRDRVAWWEHSAYGVSSLHAEGRGGAKVLNQIVADFAQLDSKSKRIVVHDGIGQSDFLNRKNGPEIEKRARIDWVLIVWSLQDRENARKRPEGFNPVPHGETDPPSQLDVYTANVRWSDVIVPAGIEVVDERLEVHGFTADDGIVIEGRVKDLSNGQPIVATMRIQHSEFKEGKLVHTNLAEAKADADGHWVLKNLAHHQVRIIIEADGYVPRVLGYGRFYDQPQWHSYDSGLTRPVSISGRVTDDTGKPLADVDVRFVEVKVESGEQYDSPTNYEFKTDAEGHFQSDQLPTGKSTVWLSKPGYCRPGLRQQITLPQKEIELQMIKAGKIRVTVDFGGKQRPKEYMVDLEPEGGNAVGKFGGNATIDDKNMYTFDNVPPDKYIVKGHPNPTSENEVSEPISIDLQKQPAADVTIKAK